MNKEEQEKKEELNGLIANHYNGSFAKLACEYIRMTGMKAEEVEALMEAIRREHSMLKKIFIGE